MLKNEARKKATLLSVVIASILLSLYTFVQAYPKTFIATYHINPLQNYAKDFSAYYIGAWRLFHDPSNVYTNGFVSDGEPYIYPQPGQFRYLPSFLIFIAPARVDSNSDVSVTDSYKRKRDLSSF
jgi:hypothetical protein